MRHLKRTLLLFFMFCIPVIAQCSNTAYGAFTCVQSCHGSNSFGASATCTFGSNVTAGHFVFVSASVYGTSTTITFTNCADVTFTTDTQVVVTSKGTMLHGWGSASATAACVPTINTTTNNSITILAVEISGSPNTLDGHATANIGAITSGSTINAANITTATNGDFILSDFEDTAQAGATYTAGTGTILVQSSTYGAAIQGQVQSTHGSITPTITNGSVTGYFATGTVAIKPTASAVYGQQVGAFAPGP
jgi:hypothetical protein